ncbi:MAG TPA: hypothetical protein VL048_16565 [Xanthobacteraceae bacterium]|nr:hypothetical protein [Xanthobacteraceae bacterium]
MARRLATAAALGAAIAAAVAIAQSADAQQPRPTTKLIALSSLVAAGFKIKAATGNQSGVVGTLVLQKDKDVYLCDAKDLSIQPTAFECWPVK